MGCMGAEDPSATRNQSSRDVRRLTLPLAVVLGGLSAFGPLSIDMYLPALPRIAADLGAPEAAVPLTVSPCLAGLGLGQLVAGPLSAALARPRPLVGALLAPARVRAARPRAGRLRVGASGVPWGASGRSFVGFALAVALTMTVLFAYVSASPFGLRGQVGISPQAFSLVFAANAL